MQIISQRKVFFRTVTEKVTQPIRITSETIVPVHCFGKLLTNVM